MRSDVKSNSRNTNQVLYYPDTCETVFGNARDNMTAGAVIVNIETDEEKVRQAVPLWML